jgi:hypothetical protein
MLTSKFHHMPPPVVYSCYSCLSAVGPCSSSLLVMHFISTFFASKHLTSTSTCIYKKDEWTLPEDVCNLKFMSLFFPITCSVSYCPPLYLLIDLLSAASKGLEVKFIDGHPAVLIMLCSIRLNWRQNHSSLKICQKLSVSRCMKWINNAPRLYRGLAHSTCIV